MHAPPDGTTSICMVGPDGTGKSVLALHLASRYAGRYRYHAGEHGGYPRVLYVSTDLSYAKARSVWHNFGLHSPIEREKALRIESIDPSDQQRDDRKEGPDCIGIWPYQPFGDDTVVNAMSPDAARGTGVYNRNFKHKSRSFLQYLRPIKGDLPTTHIAFVDLEADTAGDDWSYLTRL
ncbi:MAG: hypothetical protein HY248_03345, partial [Fimbriimonas ginsengisoli]|nr:hypothetical protein [Fimbriimonas ginsengisoli]